MKSAFVNEVETKRVDCGEFGWVDIKARYSHGDIEDMTIDEARAVDKGETSVPLLRRSIIAWGFKDGEGNTPEVTEDNIKKLDIGITAKVIKAVQDTLPLELEA